MEAIDYWPRTQNLKPKISNFTTGSYKLYTNFMLIICKLYANHMQIICKLYANYMLISYNHIWAFCWRRGLMLPKTLNFKP